MRDALAPCGGSSKEKEIETGNELALYIVS